MYHTSVSLWFEHPFKLELVFVATHMIMYLYVFLLSHFSPISSTPYTPPPDASAVDPNNPQWDHNVFASTLKLYLRELPEPVFPYSLYDEFIAAGSECNETTSSWSS